MRLVINGEARTVDGEAPTVAELLDTLKISHQAVAVMVGGTIVQRDAYQECSLQEGDALEIVRFVGGG